MAPLILHNVPDDECYIGEDGVKRPYAMYFNTYGDSLRESSPICARSMALDANILLLLHRQDGPSGSTRSRRTVAETGSFGKSTRRSRSRTGTPAARAGRENPTLAAADKLFGDWVTTKQAAAAASGTQGQEEDDGGQAATASATAAQQQSQSQSGGPQQPAQQQKKKKKANSQPTEVILRGFRDTEQQYAAIALYEQIAGTILEDYSRDPPAGQRRYQSQLRDRALTRRRELTSEERNMVNHTDGGYHWVKVTFESAEAADTAVYASPQRIMGFIVHAEMYRGVPPARDEAIPDFEGLEVQHERSRSVPAAFGTPRQNSGGMPTSFHSRLNDLSNSPSNSQVSSQTLETGTLSSGTVTDLANGRMDVVMDGSTTSGSQTTLLKEDSVFCRSIPTARRAVLLPAEQALRPQQSFMQRLLVAIPFLAWFGGSIIGNEVPRTDAGEFDWAKASLYWKIIWWLDATFRLFQGDICANDKED
jgi:hypothetical protein